MKLTDESKSFYYTAYSIVSKIPHGHVTSYGHIAYLCGKPGNSRQVGSAMKNHSLIIEALNSDVASSEQVPVEIPWWRVVSSAGKISPRENSSSEYKQAEILRDEGVSVSDTFSIDLASFGWFPEDVNI